MHEEEPETSIPQGGLLLTVGSLLLLIWGSVFSWLSVQAVEPKASTAHVTEFSAERAHEHLVEMCKETHPTGSQAAKEVREYLVRTIEEMGYEAEVQKITLPRRTHHLPYQVAYIENVIVHIPGTDSSGLYLNMAHYDSVPYGLGASDDGAGCAAMLEVLRALKHHPPLKNDVVFLFTDGEEAGLLGPRAFMQHPLYDDLELVLNYEARGYYGPSLMFELSEENGWIIDQVAQAAPSPVASSIMFDAADRMPTTTDYEVFRRAGIPGMGLAYVGGIEYYHTVNDSPEMISLASLQHHGEYGLPLALHFGNIDISEVRAPNSVYFTLLPGWLIRYPERFIPLYGALALILAIGVVTLALLRDEMTLRGLAESLAAQLAAVLLTMVIVGGVMYWAWTRHQEYLIYQTWWYYAGSVAVTIAIASTTLMLMRRRVGITAFAVAGIVWMLPLIPFSAAYFPGGSYIATWPLISAAVGLGIALLAGPKAPAALRSMPILLGAIPPMLILVPLQFLSVTGITIVPAPFWMACLLLLLGLLAVPLHWVTSVRGVWVPALSTGIALPILAFALFGLSFTKETPKMNHFCYGMNCNTGEAYWLSAESEIDAWLSNFFESTAQKGSIEEFEPGNSRVMLKAPAPATDAPQPQVEVIKDKTANGFRNLHLKIKSPRQASRLDIAVSPETPVYAASLAGHQLGKPSSDAPQNPNGELWRARYQGLVYDGVNLTLRVAEGKKVQLAIREHSFGLPPIPGIDVPPRPDNMITENNVKRFYDRNLGFRSNRLYLLKHFEI